MDSTVACLAAWMPRQRWYSAKGRDPELRLVAAWDLPDPFAGHGGERAVVTTLLVADTGAHPVVLYQVPVVARPASAVDPAADHVIGSPEPGTVLLDGPFDPSYTEALRRLVTRGGEAAGERARARGIPAAQIPDAEYAAGVLGGEQSNTSIIYRDGDDTAPIICKVFRQLHPGVNPDIELQTALAASGSAHVPGAVGSVAGTWPDPETGAPVEGSLAFAQEFLPGVEDARRVALRAAAAGEDFSARARDLGVATAEVHVSLAGLFGSAPPSADERAGVVAGWHRRLSIAAAEVPVLAGVQDAIAAVYARALDAAWPDLQRVHGDYHLGQVILTPGRGWVILDFEGEPMRPMPERMLPDLAIRDVAGALRSFDYVAGSLERERPDVRQASVRAWADAARAAFLDGYAGASGADLAAQRPLLDALELDKAVYEAIYESRNRPDWIGIPLQAIRRLV
ncbi:MULTISPECIES: maltokinase N-terminal cap-like domain-containing protein [Microbacterium]|uniref:maltokinase N-terminal cap-like domain-containing protein n=1 Tax=Microbacterium TaxID=33882 RepID=UPI00217D0774|nr:MULTISPECIES: phosphotransferase [Microbacterium]UWF77490.1 phosphotransferase [Microbacterium neungamense]WCM55653.1 phosphotransferase [Microbacterium sp. EF45047]